LETLREQTGTESIAVLIDEAVEFYAHWQDIREAEAFDKLTPRLQQVLRLIADGQSTKEIAARLGISRKTVEFHRSRLTKHLGIHAVALLARYAVRAGAIPP
jgi:RNA polymerase sigma factor (sigma-70 family)